MAARGQVGVDTVHPRGGDNVRLSGVWRCDDDLEDVFFTV